MDDFSRLIGNLRVLPEGFAEDMILKAPSKNIMNKIARSVLASYSYDSNPDDISTGNILRQSIELIARLPVMAAYGYQAKSHYHDGKSLYLHTPQPRLSTAENLLYMIRPDNKYTREEAEMLDVLLMIHAEHGGGNNSAFTTRVVSSSDTDTYSAIAAAIGSLKGPKHGGANAKVMGMMEEIKANVKHWEDDEEVKAFLAKILRKEAFDGSGLIYGMGHAIYTYSDPRCILLKEKAGQQITLNLKRNLNCIAVLNVLHRVYLRKLRIIIRLCVRTLICILALFIKCSAYLPKCIHRFRYFKNCRLVRT